MINFEQNWRQSWILTLFMWCKLFKTHYIVFDIFLHAVYLGMEHKGTEFILAFCEHKVGRSIPVLNLINDNDEPTTVNISTPKAPKVTEQMSFVLQREKSVKTSR